MFGGLWCLPQGRFGAMLRVLAVLCVPLAGLGTAAVAARTLDQRRLMNQALPQYPDESHELLHDIGYNPPGHPPTQGRVMWMEVTAYCPCPKCCGPKAAGITASGKPVSYNQGRFVAADTSILPFGTKVQIPGYADQPVEVIDRGGAIKGNKLDVFFPSHEQAKSWGRQIIPVVVLD